MIHSAPVIVFKYKHQYVDFSTFIRETIATINCHFCKLNPFVKNFTLSLCVKSNHELCSTLGELGLYAQQVLVNDEH